LLDICYSIYVMSQNIKKMFSQISPTYDQLNHVLSFNLDKGWRYRSLKLIDQPRVANLDVLDLCAGTFDYSLECLKRFPKAQITAVDFSHDMLQAGYHKIEKYIVNAQVRPLQADALNLPFDDNTFQIIICGYGVRNFDDLTKGLSEIKRVLKPGGQVIVLDFFTPENMMARFFHKTYARYIIPWLGRLISGHVGAYTYLKNSIQGFVTKTVFIQKMNEMDFVDVRYKKFLFHISHAVSAKKKS
jgi:demethylmenaquinone methyltransferase / 2-methoxy-6-polyprenyl-1,4-benzoquinol methylase